MADAAATTKPQAAATLRDDWVAWLAPKTVFAVVILLAFALFARFIVADKLAADDKEWARLTDIFAIAQAFAAAAAGAILGVTVQTDRVKKAESKAEEKDADAAAAKEDAGAARVDAAEAVAKGRSLATMAVNLADESRRSPKKWVKPTGHRLQLSPGPDIQYSMILDKGAARPFGTFSEDETAEVDPNIELIARQARELFSV